MSSGVQLPLAFPEPLRSGLCSRTQDTEQFAYHYDCAHRPQETPDEPCLRVQPAAMETEVIVCLRVLTLELLLLRAMHECRTMLGKETEVKMLVMGLAAFQFSLDPSKSSS